MADFSKVSTEQDGLTMELLKELKAQTKRLYIALVVAIAMIAVTVGGFLLYLNQYDVVSSIQQTGVYTLVDSEGNVISSDISPEQLNEILEIINSGNGQDN